MWNWQKPNWPHFRFDSMALAPLEARFLQQGGIVIGSVSHLGHEDRTLLTVEIVSAEALKTSEIEGEILDRDSLQSSIRRQFGLSTDHRRAGPAEQGIAEMMTDLYRGFAGSLDDGTLFRWHQQLMQGRRDMHDVGRYRTHPDPMQIVSGPIHAPKVHFEAPPSDRVASEMGSFLRWFKDTAPGANNPLPALTRAGLAHLYFESIHPFEDGNGRIGRAIADKALSQALGQPSLTALSAMIERRRKDYYGALERAHADNEVTDWLVWFAGIVLEAQRFTQDWISFLIAKTRLLDRLRGQVNARQEKALLRMMAEGPDGFRGGLSAGNYMSITGASSATARRDLAGLVGQNALIKTGERKGTRYWLSIAGHTPNGGS